MSAARDFAPRLLRRGRRTATPSCLEMAWFLITPPFALAALSLSRRRRRAIAGAATLAAVFGGGLIVLGLVARDRASCRPAPGSGRGSRCSSPPGTSPGRRSSRSARSRASCGATTYYGPTARA